VLLKRLMPRAPGYLIAVVVTSAVVAFAALPLVQGKAQ